MINRYVVGLLFSSNREMVAMINKLKPDWQKNRLNGISGKIGEGETPIQAMIREFKEETDTEIEDWTLILRYSDENNYEVYFYRCFSDKIWDIRSPTEESVRLIPVKTLPSNVIYNMRWIIPLCLDHYVRPPIEIEGR